MNTTELEKAIEKCASEPIHIPGLVQPHGLLLALHRETLKIEQISENSANFLDKPPSELLGTPFLDYVLPNCRSITKNFICEAAATFINPFRIPLMNFGDSIREVDAIAHLGCDDVIILEIEEQPEGYQNESGISTGIDNYLQLIQKTLSRIEGKHSVEEIAGEMVCDIRDFTGFDRVMIYRFAPDLHGEIIAEAKSEGMEPFLGLHYPASDIPSQARDLYLRNRVRLLQDVDAIPVPLVPEKHPRAGDLDLSHSVLRAMSPVHIQYLRNIGAKATLTISMISEGKLWGLIACHHREPRFVPYSVRSTASLYGTVMTSQLTEKLRTIREHRAFRGRQSALRILSDLTGHNDLASSFARALPELTELFEAHGGAIISPSEILIHGSVPEMSTLQSAPRILSSGVSNQPVVTSDTKTLYPDLAADLPRGAGLVAIPLGDGSWIIFFRDEITRTIRWAGKPSDSKSLDPSGRLNPRESFREWIDTVKNVSAPWDPSVATLTVEIRAAIAGYIQRRNQLLEESNTELRRFAAIVAHEVRNQLSSGIMALGLMRDHFKKDATANRQISEIGKRGLLCLEGLATFTDEMITFARSENAAEDEEFNLTELVNEIVSSPKFENYPERVVIDVMELPTIRGPRNQIRHLMINLIQNAMIHGKVPDRSLRIEIGMNQAEGQSTTVYVRDDGNGIDAAEQKRIFEYFYTNPRGEKKGSGIGLAFCAQIVHRIGHQIWVESEPGKGTAFHFTISEC